MDEAPRGGIAPLLDAVLAIAEDVDLDGVLDRVVRASRTMVGARYAALGVLDEQGATVARFLHVGIDDATADLIGPLPTGGGVLGELIRNPEPLMLDHITDHPASIGFPPHHPPMGAFLGVPVMIGGDVFGNLYLTDKPGGFTAQDRQLVIALAAVAGTAIRNARDVERLAVQARVDAAVADVATAVLGGATMAEGLEATRRIAADLAELPASAVSLADLPPGPAGETTAGDGGVTVRIATDGHAVHVPHHAGAAVPVLRSFGRRVAIALGYARAREQVEQLAVRLDRERIARDLHDTVIQRLFGAGLRLDGLSRQLDDDTRRDAVEAVITELDAAIADLRATIASMHDPGPLPVEDRLRAVVAAMQPITVGLQPLQVAGDPGAVPQAVTTDLVAVLREGVTNATRHAEATRITPRLEVERDRAALLVTDDGVGPATEPPAASGHGLGMGNLVARARRHGGECELVPGPQGGAQLRWWVPLPTD